MKQVKRKADMNFPNAIDEIKRLKHELSEMTKTAEDLSTRLSGLLYYFTNGKYSKDTYSLKDMQQMIEDEL